MSETLMRQWQMLRLVPRFPKKISTTDLKYDLAGEGYDIHPRSIQRDLMTLSGIFSLRCDERSKPFGWSWMADAEVMDIPGMDSHTALTFHLVEEHLKPLLPKATARLLEPHFRSAEHVLSAVKTTKGAPAWADKVKVLHSGPGLKAPVVDGTVQGEVYEALLYNRQLELTYSNREGETKESQVNPLGLVFKEGIFYLVCSFCGYQNIRLLTLHRMQSAKAVDVPATAPKDFNLDKYIEAGELSFAISGPIKLKALFSAGAAFHLTERALSDDQKIVEQQDGKMLVTATVIDTSELRWWLMSLGAGVEVLSPKSIREELITNTKALTAIYL